MVIMKKRNLFSLRLFHKLSSWHPRPRRFDVLRGRAKLVGTPPSSLRVSRARPPTP